MTLSALTLDSTSMVLQWGDDGGIPAAGAGETRRTNIVLASISVVNDPLNLPRYTTVSLVDGGSFTAMSQAQRLAVNAAFPIVSSDAAEIEGLHISNDSVTPDEIVDIDPGVAKDSANVIDLVVSSTLSPDITVAGVGGLFTGAVAADTLYAVFVIRRSDTGVVSSGFDTDAGAANIPSPYDQFRRVGWVLTDATSDIVTFTQSKSESRNRWSYFRREVQIETAGTASSFVNTTTAASGFVPSTATRQQLEVISTKLGGSGTNNRVDMVPDGWDETAGASLWHASATFSGANDPTIVNTIEMPVGPSRLVRYRVQDAGDAEADIFIRGYADAL